MNENVCVCARACMQEAVADTLLELWISYNLIEKLKGIQCMKNLRVLYMSNNLVKEWGEVSLKVNTFKLKRHVF